MWKRKEEDHDNLSDSYEMMSESRPPPMVLSFVLSSAAAMITDVCVVLGVCVCVERMLHICSVFVLVVKFCYMLQLVYFYILFLFFYFGFVSP